MFSANSCLSPNEVESILKMTSANIDQIIYNQPFAGLLGAGRLDAGKATKISKQMTLNEDLLFQDKNFNRWNFELLNSPYKIKFINYKFTDNSNTKFKAKNSIILDNGVEFKPNNSTSHKLWVDNSTTCFIPKNTSSIARKMEIVEDYKIIEKKYEVIDISIYPTLVKDKISIKSGFERDDIALLTITDINGKELLQEKIDFQNLKDIYVDNLQKGIYFVFLKNEFLDINTKIIKN